jgi:hypothetical protein
MSEPTYRTFALDDSGDLAVPIRIVTGKEATRQWLDNRFKSVLRDWFLDQSRGIPYREIVFVKNPNLQIVRSVFRQVLERTPGISKVTRFDVSLNKRELQIGPFEAILTGGQIFRSQPPELIVRFP